MDLSGIRRKRTFVNMTGDPVKGRDQRRIFVRRNVMLDYHKRRKQPPATGDTVLSLPKAEMQAAELTAGSGLSEYASAVGSQGRTNQSSDGSAPQSLVELDPWSTYLFLPKRWSTPEQGQIGRLIMRFICGQPIKAAQDRPYVVFIHRQFQHVVEEDDKDDNPLRRCRRLLRTFTKSDVFTASRYAKLWALVHEQQEEIYSLIETLGKWELLSAAQAITLYILLWIKVGSCHGTYPHGNIALLFTLGKIFKFILSRHLVVDAQTWSMPPANKWQDWIFRESFHRVSVVYFVLTLVIAMDLGFSCRWDIEKMPLPAAKALWEADSEAAWVENVGNSAKLANGLTFGSLLSNDQSCAVASWEEESDEMGLIIAMAGRLHPPCGD